MRRRFLPVGAFMVFLIASAARAEPVEVRELHYQMGTILDITVWHSDRDAAKNLIRRAVEEVHRLDGILSNYDSESALARFNDAAGSGRIAIHPELHRLLALAGGFSVKTGGYFDVTVGPLLALWRSAGEKGAAPSRPDLARTLKLVGFEKVIVYKTGEAELLNRGMQIDLGGIGKGYAVDRVVELLRQARVERALINFGGSSIYALGSPPGEAGWPIVVPDANERPAGVIYIKDHALSTSGSMGRYWDIGGTRYGHLIDPKSGMPTTRPRTATALADNATEAEALTKPLVLLGADGLAFMKNFPHAQSLAASEDGALHFSSGFAAASGFRPIQDR